MQPSHYSTCLYRHEGWTTSVSQAQSLHDYLDIDFRFKRSRTGDGSSYVASRDAAMSDVSEQTCRATVHAQSYDDVMYSETMQSGAVIARRNERERNRVKTINQTFARLRQHLPSSAAASVIKPTTHSAAGSTLTKAKKLSKVQILRAAIHYIGQLQQLLMTSDDDDDDDDDQSQPRIISEVQHTKLSLHTQYISRSSSSSSNSVSAGMQQRRLHKQTNYSSTTDIKSKTMSCHDVECGMQRCGMGLGLGRFWLGLRYEVMARVRVVVIVLGFDSVVAICIPIFAHASDATLRIGVLISRQSTGDLQMTKYSQVSLEPHRPIGRR